MTIRIRGQVWASACAPVRLCVLARVHVFVHVLKRTHKVANKALRISVPSAIGADSRTISTLRSSVPVGEAKSSVEVAVVVVVVVEAVVEVKRGDKKEVATPRPEIRPICRRESRVSRCFRAASRFPFREC